MLSVIVPIYNVEQYLPKCIESIINQTYKELEIILVDDGSTDSSSQICDRYAQQDHRIKVIHKKNEGLVRARKSGLNNAKGEYITFVDGDDWIDSDMYLNLLESLKNSDADFVDSGFYYDRDGKSCKGRILQRGIYELDEYIRHKLFMALLDLDDSWDIKQHVFSKIFKAELIKRTYEKTPDIMQYGEDAINMVHCILNANKMIQVDEVFYHYNFREESLSHFKSKSYIRREMELWSYCGNIIINNDKFMMQDDIDQSLFRKLYYAFTYLLPNEFDVIQYYKFPYIEKLYFKKVAIYGAGKVGKDYLTQISKYEKCEVVCWVDKNYKNIQLEYRKVIGVDQLLGEAYDIILIAIEKKERANKIRESLIEAGVQETKIIWYEPTTVFE